MSFRAKLLEHLTAMPVTEVKKLVSKYNKELDIRPISKLKKAEILAKISAKKPMDKQLLTKLTNEARATREGKKAQKASEKEAAKKPVEKFGTEKKKIKVKKPKAAKAEPKKSAPKAMPKEDAKAFAAAFAKAPEEEKGSLFSEKPKKKATKEAKPATKKPVKKLPNKTTLIKEASDAAIASIESNLENENLSIDNWDKYKGNIADDLENYIREQYEKIGVFQEAPQEKTYKELVTKVEKKVIDYFTKAAKKKAKKPVKKAEKT